MKGSFYLTAPRYFGPSTGSGGGLRPAQTDAVLGREDQRIADIKYL